jgi:rSAM/selenodomain-associated transferase 2
MTLAIIVPVLNEAAGIEAALAALAPLRARGARLIVVDGGSSDDSAGRAASHADLVLGSAPGRALQMNTGAASGAAQAADALLFLHADTRLPPKADTLIAAALTRRVWGRFDVEIDGHNPLLPLVAALMNRRSRWTGIATGDQAIFIRRDAFDKLGGYAPLPLMEDIEFCRRARHLSHPACIAVPVLTSGRRWERHGLWRTIFLMWRLRAAYWLGADPAQLAQRYREAR